MVPFFGWALLHDGGDNITWRWIAFALFCVAMITDKIDGDLARKHNLVTNFGKIADPIADKAMTGMAFIGLAIIGDFLPAWLWWTITVDRAGARVGGHLRPALDRQGRGDAGQAERQGQDRCCRRSPWAASSRRSACSPAASRCPATSSGGSRR